MIAIRGKRPAPKARNIIARGKREWQRNAAPLVTKEYFEQSTESAKYHVNYSALSELHGHCARSYQGRRASRCSALAPGFHIPRLWRSVPTFCAKPQK